jgi:uncharacterized membrane protein YtjA (UPF0391 family)
MHYAMHAKRAEIVHNFWSEEKVMLYWALVFFIVAILAGAFGFFGLAAGAAEIAKILFFVFLVLFLVSLLTGMRPRGTI